MSAARTPAAVRSSERAIDRQRDAGDQQTPAASPSTPSIRLITLIIATMPSGGADVAEVDRAAARQAQQLDRAGVELAEEGDREAVDRHPGGDGDDDRRVCPSSFAAGFSVVDIVEHADRGNQRRAGEDRPRLGVPGQPDQAADEDGGEDRQAA